ncbi:4Fe-4S ferredoxin [candidate division WOR-3 bacterium 4484_100]|uniref:4Fe-4S ferredoxin n=1 Tax=candidate division WOR-3 bacterium 4484_100 TaxID=1936077 RepID=A0A1V4QE78_UNCW3|nr:MAG: 4Fe-4S ferredoxin [candidate division WOR-3 bacterium 4484_100]
MNSGDSKSGAVLVVGAGIAGIQSSLDLANSGFKVYLVDRSPAIGGIMAQLDKTFPTNDCAMCIMSPKLVECGRHLNIEFIPGAQVKKVEGGPGNFQVKIYKRPRFIDLDKCTGCGECAKVCPVSVPSEFDEAIIDRRAVYRLYAQAYPNAYAIDKKARPPCQSSCPAGVHAQGYIALIREKKFKEAYELIRKNNPFPAICGRICHHPCEQNCRRGEYDDPIAIASLKRFVADYIHKNNIKITQEKNSTEKREEKVAVIGAGPAGLTCANDLVQLGYRVTIFEAQDKPGGMMRMGIPAYRLPRNQIDWEIELLLKNGIELRTNSPIKSAADIKKLKDNGFKAIFIGVGAQKARPLKIKGADLSGVILGLDFLKAVNLGQKVSIGKKVVIIGGGNVAVDVARCALRLGAEKVDLFCLESKSEMPAHIWEIEEAIEEGIRMHPSWGPIQILGDGGEVKAIEFKRCTSVFDEEGRFNPSFDETDTTSCECDNVIIAIGQASDFSFLEGTGIDITPFGTIKVDPITMATSVPGIFAGGDAVKGPASVIDAIAQAHEAAVSIHRYLNNEDMKAGRERVEELPEKEYPRFVPLQRRIKMPMLAVEERIKTFDEFELGFSEEMAVAEAERCLECGQCSECLECVRACEADAVLHNMIGEERELNVGAIILAMGADKFDPSSKYEFGYNKFRNVLTSIQFERILSASGPYQGHIQRPSDGKVPKKVAWVQCVGSRDDDAGNKYCSSVCCMYAIKEAVIAKEHIKEIEPTIFYMDIRAFGKDFDKYYERAKNEYGVRFIRARVGRIKQIEDSGNLIVYYKENGSLKKEEFDLVVLSVGFKGSEEAEEVADRLGIKLNQHKFFKTHPLSSIETTRGGIFVCGVAEAPKDIPETVTQASAAACGVQEILFDVRGTQIKEKTYPAQRDVTGEPPRIGVFICHCGINIGSVVDVPSVVEYAKKLPDVVHAEDNLFTCSQDTQEKIKQAINEFKLNRVIVASCSPRTHEPLFQETLREAGLNPHLFEMANIRDQCSWVHMNEPEKATEKAKRLVQMAVAKARLLESLSTVMLPITQKGLVIGAGLAGMVSAISIAQQGFDVVLVERESELGGNLRNLFYTIDGQDVQSYLKDLIEQIENNPRIKVYKNATVKNVDGYIGNFKTTIEIKDGSEVEVEHGVIILATGAKESKPGEYLYGENQNVVTQLELERMITEAEKHKFERMKNIVMIQCVGSRNDEHPYCSRVCCQDAIKNAIRLKEIAPKLNVYVLYRDIRAYGYLEEYYQRARELGVIFIRYDTDQKPVVDKQENKLRVRVIEPIIKKKFVITADLVVLAPAIVPQDDALEISKMLKVPLNEDNFFLEAHVKLRPVDFATDGVFFAGLAHAPKNIRETIAQAKAAAARALTILSKKEYESSATIATVDESVCAGCGLCVSTCSYGALELVQKYGRMVSAVNRALCKGCGNCSAVCPSGAISHLGYRTVQTSAMVSAALEFIE